MAIRPPPPSSPATRTSRQATPSGYGRASSTMKSRRSAMVNIVPSMPPSNAITKVNGTLTSVHIPRTSKDGTVKMIPAASDSPALAMVWTELFSRMETSSNRNPRKMSMDMTAAGIDAETVNPTFKPR